MDRLFFPDPLSDRGPGETALKKGKSCFFFGPPHKENRENKGMRKLKGKVNKKEVAWERNW